MIVPKDVFQAAFQEASGGHFHLPNVNKGLLGVAVAEGIGQGPALEGNTLRIDLAELERLAKAVPPKGPERPLEVMATPAQGAITRIGASRGPCRSARVRTGLTMSSRL